MAQLNRTRNQGWTMEDGYPDYEQTFPERGSGAGAKAGLELKLTELEEHLDNFCKGRLSGFKILLHNPCDLPRPSQQYIRIPTYADVTLSFIASMEMTSEGLEVFSPTGRQCYFAEERTLTYFRQYTQSNCEFECLTNYTYARCGCVHFSMPHGPNMAICNVGSTDCINKAETELATFDIDDEQRGNVTIEQAFYIAIECNCLPACNSIAYETETTLSVLHDEDRHTFRLNWRDFDLETYKVSNIMLFFKKSQFELWIRSELYGTSDILASCEGLLGLFMGFSVINIIEILYFCILSICRRHKTAQRHPDEEELEHSKDKF
ncbi:pickpocket protein 28-like [Bicyclus anynana]|uniref:Pickpocket protein 28-like n=1 Tax=Bicyclus anynana TaxID=110368 RepID=A0A6J1NV01_BICAN|nr:pickpocket protein 28-like [Bicyclus anynana]